MKARTSGLSSLEIGVASAGLVPVGHELLHYRMHSRESSPRGLPQRNAGLPTNRRCASLQTGLPPGPARMRSFTCNPVLTGLNPILKLDAALAACWCACARRDVGSQAAVFRASLPHPHRDVR